MICPNVIFFTFSVFPILLVFSPLRVSPIAQADQLSQDPDIFQ